MIYMELNKTNYLQKNTFRFIVLQYSLKQFFIQHVEFMFIT